MMKRSDPKYAEYFLVSKQLSSLQIMKETNGNKDIALENARVCARYLSNEQLQLQINQSTRTNLNGALYRHVMEQELLDRVLFGKEKLELPE